MKSLLVGVKRWITFSHVASALSSVGAASLVTSVVMLALGVDKRHIAPFAVAALVCSFIAIFVAAMGLHIVFAYLGILSFIASCIVMAFMFPSGNMVEREACVEKATPGIEQSISSLSNKETAQHYSELLREIRDRTNQVEHPRISVRAFCEEVTGLKLAVDESARIETLG